MQIKYKYKYSGCKYRYKYLKDVLKYKYKYQEPHLWCTSHCHASVIM